MQITLRHIHLCGCDGGLLGTHEAHISWMMLTMPTGTLLRSQWVHDKHVLQVNKQSSLRPRAHFPGSASISRWSGKAWNDAPSHMSLRAVGLALQLDMSS